MPFFNYYKKNWLDNDAIIKYSYCPYISEKFGHDKLNLTNYFVESFNKTINFLLNFRNGNIAVNSFYDVFQQRIFKKK